ncbi:MAG: hypothetical protein JW754_04650 [Candidatus Aenigmarchaeota archaeon]|nr:hypothetical protein [Candidatus Aenigmarchaeota archaeon]
MASKFRLKTSHLVNVLRAAIIIIVGIIILVIAGIAGQFFYTPQEIPGIDITFSEPFLMEENQEAYMESENMTLLLKEIIYKPLVEGVRGVWSGKGASIMITKDGSITTTSLSIERNTFEVQGMEIVLGNVTTEFVEFTVNKK